MDRRDVSLSAHRLVAALCTLLLIDLGGGLLAVGSGVNTWADAWGGRALLAAPLPMMVAQALLTWWAVRSTSRGAVTAAVLLAVACLVSVVSGFFDGGIGNNDLTPALAAYQALLLVATGVTGALGALRAVRVSGVPRAPVR
jgi:hypothetical protein